jgi:hypothetical protein
MGITPRLEPFHFLVAVTEPSCRDVQAVIQCYVDGECDLWTMMAVANHLDRCGACCDEVQMWRWLKAAVRRCAGHGPSGHSERGNAPESPLWH